MTEPVPDTWQEALTRRLRTLLRTVPLMRIEASKGKRGLALDEHDLRALALRAIDRVIEQMGLGTGPTVDELVEALVPLVRASDPEVEPSDAEAIARLVVDELLNERDRRRAFGESYLAIEPDGPVRRRLDFHLLKEHSAPDGSIVLKATTDAINLYAGMLEYPVEDAQIAEEAVLRSQVSRGRIADAVQTARRARLRSIEYEQKLLGYLETSRRDVTQIDWVRDVLALIGDARVHLEDRIDTEGDLIRAVDDRLDGASGEAGAQLAALRDVLDECLTRHLRLQRRLITANQVYLDEHDRQVFRPRALGSLPDLEADILRPVLELEGGFLAEHVDWLLSRLQPPRCRPVLHLSSLVSRLLAPRRESHDEELDLTPAELERLGAAMTHFSEADHESVEALLGDIDGETALSELLAEGRRRDLSPSGLRLLVLSSLQAFAPRDEAPLRARCRGLALEDRAFVGDDLLIGRVG